MSLVFFYQLFPGSCFQIFLLGNSSASRLDLLEAHSRPFESTLEAQAIPHSKEID